MIRTMWVTAAALAILAMQGLASHGAAHAAAPTFSVSGSTHAGDHPVAAAEGSPEAGVASTPEHGGPGHAMGVFGLCLAVLATAAITLLRLVRPRSGLLAVLPRPVHVASRPSGPVHGLGPPDLHALSVLRC